MRKLLTLLLCGIMLLCLCSCAASEMSGGIANNFDGILYQIFPGEGEFFMIFQGSEVFIRRIFLQAVVKSLGILHESFVKTGLAQP